MSSLSNTPWKPVNDAGNPEGDLMLFANTPVIVGFKNKDGREFYCKALTVLKISSEGRLVFNTSFFSNVKELKDYKPYKWRRLEPLESSLPKIKEVYEKKSSSSEKKKSNVHDPDAVSRPAGSEGIGKLPPIIKSNKPGKPSAS